MHGTVTQTFVTFGCTAQGYAVDVTYRIAGSPHVFRYVEERGLLLAEAYDLIDAAISALRPGAEWTGVAGQLSLERFG